MRWLAALLMISAGAAMADDWTSEQKALAGVFYTALAMDYGQTRTIAKDPTFHENNPLLPAHPSMGQVNAHFAIAAVGAGLLFYFVPDAWRSGTLLTLTAIEVGTVAYNYHVGIRVSF